MTATRTTALLGACAILVVTAARADDAPVAAPAADASPFSYSGYLDASYTDLSGTGAFTSGVADRVFDAKHSGFTLQQAAINLGYQPKVGFGAFLNLTAGADADVIAPYSLYGKNHKFDVTQAYAQYATPSVTVIAGRFVTLAGAEVIASPSDPNFSRSLLFGLAIPFTHTGLRATYAASDSVSLVLGVNNGWDDLKDTNTSKTLEVGATYAPVKTFTLAASGYFGKERIGYMTNAGPEGQRSLLDIVATWAVTERLTVILNGDWGEQRNVADGVATPHDARWSGLAGYLNYAFSDKWKGSLRAEYLDDAGGYRTGVVQKYSEVTVTLAYLPAKAVELRVEGRVDSSDRASFVKNAAGDAASSQNSASFQALYKF